MTLAQRQKLPNTQDKVVNIFSVKRIAERQHGHTMSNLGKSLHGRGPDAFRGTVIAYQIGKACFDITIALPQGVIVTVGNVRRIFLVISCVMDGNFLCQSVQFFGRLFARQLRDRFGAAHRASASSNLPAAARASGVMLAPDSMRATSSRRASASSELTRVTVASNSLDFDTFQ